METEINKEIRNYTESIFFGLSMRQFVFSLLAVGVAVSVYFLLKPYVGTETVSWMCVLAAAPFAAFGFVHYHGMNAGRLFLVWFRDKFSTPRYLYCKPKNELYESICAEEKNKRKRRKKHESTAKHLKKR